VHPISVLAIDDHELFRTGLELIVRQRWAQAHVATFASLGHALDARLVKPDAILLDLHLDGINGQDAIPLLKLRWPEAPIVVVTSERSRQASRLAREAGAVDVVMKSDPPERLVTALQAALGARNEDLPQADRPTLSRRQIEVLRLLGSGHSNKAIANLLGISEFTVRGHVQQILRALDTSSRAQAVYLAQQSGIL